MKPVIAKDLIHGDGTIVKEGTIVNVYVNGIYYRVVDAITKELIAMMTEEDYKQYIK